MPTSWSSTSRPSSSFPDHVTRLADPLVVNEHEALRFLGLSAGQPHDLAGALVEAGPRSAVLTLGARGALVAEQSEGHMKVTEVPAPKVRSLTPPQPATRFVGVLAWRLSVGDPLVGAAIFAVRAGARAVTVQGAQSPFPDDANSPLLCDDHVSGMSIGCHFATTPYLRKKPPVLSGRVFRAHVQAAFWNCS